VFRKIFFQVLIKCSAGLFSSLKCSAALKRLGTTALLYRADGSQHNQEVVGSNPGTVYWMDVSDLLAITLKRKFENKGSQMVRLG